MNFEKLKKPTLSKEKILENNQRVVDRLYKKEIKKIKEKNKFVPEIISYKDNLKKRHKISFKHNVLSKEREVNYNDRDKFNKEELKKDINITDSPPNLEDLSNKQNSVKGFSVHYNLEKNDFSQYIEDKNNKKYESDIFKLTEEYTDDKQSIKDILKSDRENDKTSNLNEKKEEVVELIQMNEDNEKSRRFNEFENKENSEEILIKSNRGVVDDNTKSHHVEVKSKTLQNLLSKSKK